MERRSTKTTSLIEDIAYIEGSKQTRFSHATIKITPSSENASCLNRKDKNEEKNQNEGIIGFKFVANSDCDLLDIKPAQKSEASAQQEHTTPIIKISIKEDAPLLSAQNLLEDSADANGAKEIALHMEDAVNISNGREHDFAITYGSFGSRFYLDGYQCFASATNLGPQRVSTKEAEASTSLEKSSRIYDFYYSSHLPNPEEIANSATQAQPDIWFAGPTICARDIKRVSCKSSGTLHIQFRLRGPGQHGVLFAAGTVGAKTNLESSEKISVYAGPEGIKITLIDSETCVKSVIEAAASVDDGEWHDLIIRANRGATDIYVDGYSESHNIGQFWFANIPELDAVSIGEDLRGVRLMGEARTGGIYFSALTEGQIQRISKIKPLVTTALFDTGYAGSRSYRIPSLVKTRMGTLIAGADQRTSVSNDAPNHINFVIRRSADGGKTWGPLQTVIDMPGKNLGKLGASAIDSCPVLDPEGKSERINVLIDINPGGIGLTNCKTAVGVDACGRIKLIDRLGGNYAAAMDASAAVKLPCDSSEKECATKWLVFPDGSIKNCDSHNDLRNNSHSNQTCDSSTWNIWKSQEIASESQPLFAEKTCYIAQIYSDDDGKTWSAPRLIDHMVKEPWMSFAGVCPGNGIVIRQSEKHYGRILVPFYCSGQSKSHYSSGALISDDDGKTWSRGKMINEGRLINGKIVDPITMQDDDATSSETVFVERKNGDILAFFRNQNRSGCVGKAISHDCGETWSELIFDTSLPEIFSQPSATCFNSENAENADCIAFANASQMMPYRGRGVVRFSYDGGKTWAKNVCINPFHHVYQCLSSSNKRTLQLLWERETTGIYITAIDSNLWKQDNLQIDFKSNAKSLNNTDLDCIKNKINTSEKMKDLEEGSLTRTERSQHGRDI
ncbi:sialidase family protein [Gardnerella vaginalis]|uniref:sialidase family protein n=1 Tax=Gardnerella vaginalis TaxID=2702 RepID=UPI002551BBF1|nr:sialidase family protein [Gardnerella vaginalis]MDK7211583.1 sialidase family protein [Gardnerella vaginalis]MDK8337163.1 sialidase family protein [Gardnerella vaginalis]